MQAKEKIEKTLETIASGLKQTKGDFYIIGASAMILSGVDIGDTEDVDILVSESDARMLKERWKEYVIESYTPQHSDIFRSFFRRYTFNPMDVEVLGDLEVNINGKWTLLTVEDYTVYTLGDLHIKLPTLYEQRRILTLFGREKDMRRIDFIDRYLAKY